MSKPTGLGLPNPTANRGFCLQTATRIEPVDSRAFVAGATISADVAYLVWFRVDTLFTATAMEYMCVSAAGNVDLGIFRTTDFSSFTLIGSTGATAASGSTAMQAISLTASVPLAPGVDYYAALVGSSASLSIGRIAPFAGAVGATRLAYFKAALNPLATFSSPSNGAIIPLLAIT